MNEPKWIDNDLITPTDYWRNKWKGVIDLEHLAMTEYIVTGQLINKDPQDDDEVFVATWCFQDNTWRYTLDKKAKYGEHGWKIIAWQHFPEPFVKE